MDKSNEFTMDHVQRHWEQRPWRYDTVGLDERLDPDINLPEAEFEVDGVSSRRFLRGKYKYSVSFKGWDKVSLLQPRMKSYEHQRENIYELMSIM